MIGLKRKPDGGFDVVQVSGKNLGAEEDIKHVRALRDSYDRQMSKNIKRCQELEADNEDFQRAIIALDKYLKERA